LQKNYKRKNALFIKKWKKKRLQTFITTMICEDADICRCPKE